MRTRETHTAALIKQRELPELTFHIKQAGDWLLGPPSRWGLTRVLIHLPAPLLLKMSAGRVHMN